MLTLLSFGVFRNDWTSRVTEGLEHTSAEWKIRAYSSAAPAPLSLGATVMEGTTTKTRTPVMGMLVTSGQLPEPARPVATVDPMGARRLPMKATRRVLNVWSSRSTN